jgi:hypothetical protein
VLTALLAASTLSGLWFLWLFLTILAGVVLFLFVVAPLFIFFTHRQSPAPDVIPHDPGPVATPADEFFNDLGPRLADLGFSETQRWSFSGFATNVASELCTMADRRRRVLAIGNAMHVRRQGAFRLQARFLEFATRTEDGRTLATTNSPTPMLYTEIGGRRIVQLTSVRDPAVLLKAHELLVARDGLAATAQDPPARDAIPGRIREAISIAHEWQVEHGLLRILPSGVRKLTLKGAFLYTWVSIPPGKQFLARRRAAREKALLQELGL